ncbi:MAG: type I methionyl aminopeptidase [Candidatus Atribacteria bacterium]|nr:type I methionyl aminopeptidase [Candidatus Atribacteria bacterium]
MIHIKSEYEIKKMRKAGELAGKLLKYIEPFVKKGVSTLYLNDLCEDFTKKHGAISAPLNYNGFPKSICTSINNVVCHGIPSKKEILKDGDILNIDVTVKLDGYHGDTSKTYLVGNVNEEAKYLVMRTENAMYRGIGAVKPGKYLYEVGKVIEKYISKFGYSIVHDFVGHGIGKMFHEDPQVFHHYSLRNKVRLQEGMIFTIEPMINMGKKEIRQANDGWTISTVDKKHSAHSQFEHTVLVTPKGFEILTKV